MLPALKIPPCAEITQVQVGERLNFMFLPKAP